MSRTSPISSSIPKVRWSAAVPPDLRDVFMTLVIEVAQGLRGAAVAGADHGWMNQDAKRAGVRITAISGLWAPKVRTEPG